MHILRVIIVFFFFLLSGYPDPPLTSGASIHLSCSDDFMGKDSNCQGIFGFGDKGGPMCGVDGPLDPTDAPLIYYYIAKCKDGAPVSLSVFSVLDLLTLLFRHTGQVLHRREPQSDGPDCDYSKNFR